MAKTSDDRGPAIGLMSEKLYVLIITYICSLMVAPDHHITYCFYDSPNTHTLTEAGGRGAPRRRPREAYSSSVCPHIQNPELLGCWGINAPLALPSIVLVYLGTMSSVAALQALVEVGNDMCVLHLRELLCQLFVDFSLAACLSRFAAQPNVHRDYIVVEMIPRLKYYTAAAATLFFFDYLLTLPDEVCLI